MATLFQLAVDFQIKKVQHGDHHGFYLVQSNIRKLPSFFCDTTDNRSPTVSACEEMATTVAMEAQISVHADFLQDKWFYIKSKASGLVLDVDHGFGRDHTKGIAAIGLNHQKLYSSSACHPLLELQLWRLENGYIVNRLSRMVLDVDNSEFKPGRKIIQWTHNEPEKSANQQWAVSSGFIHLKDHPNLVLDVRGNSTYDGAYIGLGERNENNFVDQHWSFEAITFSWSASQTSSTYTAETEEDPQSSPGACTMANEAAPLYSKSGINNNVLEVESRNHRTTACLMKDVKTMDVALTFGIYGGARNIALWAHRSVLRQEPGLARLLSKLKDVEGPSTGSQADFVVQSYHVTEYSLEAYCCLVRFLYSGKIEVQVVLNDFAIGSPPSKPFSIACKERIGVEGLFPSTDIDNLDPLVTTTVATLSNERSTTFGELFQLADCYEVKDLRGYCRARIIESMDASNAMSILFGFAYRFEDLKSVVLKFVVDHLDKMYAGEKDPFEEYKDHPERSTLLADMLKLKFKAPA
ncbi:hypothetical protein BG006_007292 [Podila minutissima]|uniref:BTB domain-containing protein n=1 Tax=Podila minutissima TaxID=64525 RepID=A0A9P5SK20_9FUNG|nr:hypothetical protein BG006_007292 [Podila minutissima]